MADMTSEMAMIAPQNPPEEQATTPVKKTTGRDDENGRWLSRIAMCRRLRRNLILDWAINVDYRRGKLFDTDSDQDRIAITADWSMTKAKQAQLFSQVPEVRLKERNKQYEGAVPTFARKLNETLGFAEVGTAMDECLPDCINASGVAAVLIAYETRTEMRDYTTPQPSAHTGTSAPDGTPAPGAPAELALAGLAMPEGAGPGAPPAPSVTQIPYTTAKRFTIERLSPSDLLWDMTFTGSNFNKSPWQGRSGRIPWSRAIIEFGKSEDNPHGLVEADKSTVCGQDNRSPYDMLTHGEERERYKETNQVSFEEIFYWRYLFHVEERSYEAIQRKVFVSGKTEPVIDEEWQGQRRGENDSIIGSCKMPIQFLTLTYVSDEAIPPSDTAMGRPQVDELVKSRSQMVRQRDHSIPVRGFNVNLVAPEVATSLMRGTWQGMIPFNGSGERAIWEVARSAFPREDFEFDRIAKADLAETWQVGSSTGSGGGSGTQIRSAAEANNIQANFSTRVGYERGRVVRFFLNIAEVLAGLLSLYGDWTDEEKRALASWDMTKLPGYFIYSVRADSTVLLDAGQRYDRLERYLNISAKSGMVDEVPVLKEMAGLVGIDESIVRPPQPKGPEPANISLRITGDDLQNPAVVALLAKLGQLPSPEELAAAKKYIMESVIVPPPAPPAPGGPAGPPAPAGPEGATPPVIPPSGGTDAHPAWDMAGRLNKRMQDGR